MCPMARPLRVEHEGAVYHILSRGNRAEFIFEEDSDKEYFLQILQKAAERYGIVLYAYCIMGNHYHLLVGVPFGMLSKVMHAVQSSYGSYLQRERGWIGHVFAGRYKSLCVEKEGYLLELSRYIHLNPVKAGIVKKPEEYLWTSYRCYMGEEKKPEWLTVEWLLQEYGKSFATARRKYREFVEAGIDSPPFFPAERIAGQAILGSKEFIEKVTRGIRKEGNLGDVTAGHLYRRTIALAELYREVCRFYRLKGIAKGKSGGQGRDMFIYLAKRETGAMNREIGEMAGGISFSAVTHQYARTLKRLEGDRKAMKEWTREAEEILSNVKG